MTVAQIPLASGPARAARVAMFVPARLLRLELRRSAMVVLVPVAVALFFLDTFHPTVKAPPLWGLRVLTFQQSTLRDFGPLSAGVAAWMGSRDRRRGTDDLVAVTAPPRWASLIAT